MFNLLAYGSLLSKAELSNHSFGATNTIPVFVDGFRRSFNQEPSWRLRKPPDRAVLRVEQHRGGCFNAILVMGIHDAELESLDERERGYNRVHVDESQLRPFHNDVLPVLVGNTYLYCGKPEKRNQSLLPNPSYLALCIRGAADWGEDFREAFLCSTFVAEETVDRYLSSDLTRS